MLTFQDFEKVDRKESFILDAISQHKGGKMYHTAMDAVAYDRQENVTIMQYVRTMRTLQGKEIEDPTAANNKICSNFFNQFVTQLAMYLLGNGVFFADDNIKNKLGKTFDTDVQRIARSALVQGVSFGFWNYDRLVGFDYTEFVPLWDEETGALRAGIRFWQLDSDKPLRVTLYEEDGITEYRQIKGGNMEMIAEKKAYKYRVQVSKALGEEIVGQENYSGLPIIPMWGNPMHKSELTGIRSEIDAYDRVRSGFTNDFDDHSLVYWIIENANGMKDADLAKFLDRIKTVGAAMIDSESGQKATRYETDIPYAARVAFLEKMRNDLFDDFGAVNTDRIAGGNVLAAQIDAAYDRLDAKADQFEYEVIKFIDRLLELVGITDDGYSFKRRRIRNETEFSNMILSAGNVLDEEAMLDLLPFITPEQKEDYLKRRDTQETGIYGAGE